MIYIIVLNWNGWNDTIECLESLLALSFSKYRIVICDNNSSDNSIQEISRWIQRLPDSALYLQEDVVCHEPISKSQFQFVNYQINPDAHPDKHHRICLIQTGENRGYGAGNNVGIQFSLKDDEARYFWILNNDVVVSPESLAYLYRYSLEHKAVGIVGSKLMFYHQPERIQAVGGKYNKYLAITTHVGEFEKDRGQYDYDEVVQQIDYPVGAAMFVSKAYVENVGLLSEDYFLYFEEIDWVSRGRALGWQLGYCWQSIVFHKEGGATGSDADPCLKSRLSDTYSLINRMRFTKKFHRHWIWTVRLGLLVSAVNRIRRGQFDRLGAIYRALTS